ncbi:PC4-domain-containing protein [Cenococcum geophilum 1.58]|uniref:PC4-domain-containing protein n=1 Tax=Cenococcum geophilum 1.58 TaxID=794803 RepID=UPI000DC9002B|nr:PC4-domain-containing protein [Cenococcum geophilum 1.58]
MKRTSQIARKNSRPAKIFTNKKRSASIDESDSEPKSKKGKKSKTQVHSTERPKMKKDSDGNEYWEISKNRRVGISNFKGMALVNIREYYEKDGEMQPGKKGISLSLDQYSNLISILPDIEKLLIKKGEQVPRPEYNGGNKLGDNKKDTDSEEGDEESEEKEAYSASDEEDEED